MAGITLAQAEEKLATYMAAEDAIMNRGQSYSINGRSLSRADLGEIREGIDYWQSKVQTLSASGSGRRGPRYAVTR